MQSVPLPSDSPIKASPAPAPERRKRVSHRMSLVPSGKNFEPFASPIKSRRHSIIRLGEEPQVIRTPKKSGLAQQIEEEEDLQEEEEDVFIEAVDGEEGDVLYVETREEEEVEVGDLSHPILRADNVVRAQQSLHDPSTKGKGASATHQCRT
jgi:hypothetical protein